MPHRHRTESLTSPRRLAAAERQRQALALRSGGASFDQIAKSLGFANRSGAYLAVMAALRRVPEPEVKSYRALNLERLNTMRLRYWTRLQAAGGLAPGDLELMRMELAIQQQEARYLGLDAPVKTELTGKDGRPLELAAIILTQKLQRIVEADASMPLGDGKTVSVTALDNDNRQ